MKKVSLGTIRFDPRDATKAQGHEYGAGRGERVLRHKNVRREKDRLRKELRE